MTRIPVVAIRAALVDHAARDDCKMMTPGQTRLERARWDLQYVGLPLAAASAYNPVKCILPLEQLSL